MAVSFVRPEGFQRNPQLEYRASQQSQYYHDKFYPSGTAIATKDYYGVELKGVKYEQAAAVVDGYARRVETPAELKAALGEALASIAFGKSAILNMIMPAKMR